jgi:hypothetical protein
MLKKFTGVYSSVETITPEMAAKYLERNNSNRKINKGRVTVYAKDMIDNNWTDGSPIGFFADGDLADGQHRLLAIVESGVPVVMTVIYNLAKESKLNHNTGIPQRAAANIQMFTGSDMVHGVRVPQATAYLKAIIEMEVSASASVLSPSDLVDKFECIADGLKFIAPYVRSKRKGVSASVIWGTVIAASYVVDKAKLTAFCEVFSGQRNAVDACESMVMRFAQIVILSNHAGYASRLEVYRRTQRCVEAFVENQSLKKFYASDRVVYSAKERLGYTNDQT